MNVEKVSGADNCSDILTKHVDNNLIMKHLANMSLSPESGRAGSAPQLVTSIGEIVDTAMFFPRLAHAGDVNLPKTKEISGADPRDWILFDGELIYAPPPIQGGV